MRNLRLPGALIGLGFGGILFWTVADLAVVSPPQATTLVYWITTTAGYGLAGFACWRWITKGWTSEAGESPTRGPSRWMAAASLVTAAGVAALTYQLYQNRPGLEFANLDFHYGLRLTGYVVGTLGFLLAAVGFWAASNARPAEPRVDPGHPANPGGKSLSDPVPASSDGIKI
jgi:hypothetical protein